MDGYEDLTAVPTEELRLQLVAAEAQIARLRSSQTRLVAELDRRKTGAGDGCASLGEWVAGRVDVAAETAKTLVATAKRLVELPFVSGALAAGEVTWDRVVELARVASSDDELEVLIDSADTDIAGLRQRRGRRRRVGRGEEREAFAQRYLAVQPTLDRELWRLSGQLPPVAGKIVAETLTALADELPAFPDGTKAPLSQRRADALVALCRGEEAPSPVVSIVVDTTGDETAATVVAGPRVGPDTLEAALCDGRIEVTALTADGIPLGIGRTSRAVPARLRRSVLSRDGGCVADGCTSTYRLQVHHKVAFAQGGRTDAENLVTLCWYHHHTVVHGHGFTIEQRSPEGRIRFRPPGVRMRSPPPSLVA